MKAAARKAAQALIYLASNMEHDDPLASTQLEEIALQLREGK
jgi:hypothetical protein